MPFLLTRANLEDLKTDAKVIGSCPYRTGTWNTNWEPDLWAEQRMIRQLQVGQAMMTSGQQFDCKFGIITLPPIWEGGERKETLHLAACYDNSLRLAHKRRCRTVAFTLLSGDCNGFPRDLALKTAVDTIGEFLQKHEMTVYLSVKDAWAQHLPKPEIPGLSQLEPEQKLSPQALFEQAIRGKAAAARIESSVPCPQAAEPEGEAHPKGFSFMKSRHLDSLVAHPEDSFSLSLLKRIDERGLKDPQVYQKANLDRRLFSKIRSNPGYQPSKATALSLCLALELPLADTEALLQKAGYALSPSNPFDIILRYYISEGKYDLYEINQTLFLYDQPLLGA